MIVFEKKSIRLRICYIYCFRNNLTYKTIYLITVFWMFIYCNRYDKGLSVRDWCSCKKKKFVSFYSKLVNDLSFPLYILISLSKLCLSFHYFNFKVHILLFTQSKTGKKRMWYSKSSLQNDISFRIARPTDQDIFWP